MRTSAAYTGPVTELGLAGALVRLSHLVQHAFDDGALLRG